ncbi:hypothetical protein [Natrinema salsiterrestre]|uniref:Uncharacterized protein n=1 Tax=Natrinema salsiterrestre TaxID=2950540 RepID=A0A9Q4Q4X2_9EURY|nr:hypothetical protein [Natrinema salsiterrestre]MDF9747962.1 hypothetical protein [Natrinema salsiterrestre]
MATNTLPDRSNPLVHDAFRMLIVIQAGIPEAIRPVGLVIAPLASMGHGEHVLPTEVSDQESALRSDLADELEAGEVSKTDAREFALKYAFENPGGVAELMREEGYGLTD